MTTSERRDDEPVQDWERWSNERFWDLVTELRESFGIGDVVEKELKALREKSGINPAKVGRSRLNIKFSDARGLQLTIAAAILADAASHDVRIEAVVGLVAAALDRVRILKDEELEVFDVLLDLSFGEVYKVWVQEAQIIEALPADQGAEAKRRTLANMKSRGILEEGGGWWRAVL